MDSDKVLALAREARIAHIGVEASLVKFAALLQQQMIADGWRSPEQVKAMANEALDDVASWSAYADDYFKDKWNLLADLNKWAERAGTPLRSENE